MKRTGIFKANIIVLISEIVEMKIDLQCNPPSINEITAEQTRLERCIERKLSWALLKGILYFAVIYILTIYVLAGVSENRLAYIKAMTIVEYVMYSAYAFVFVMLYLVSVFRSIEPILRHSTSLDPISPDAHPDLYSELPYLYERSKGAGGASVNEYLTKISALNRQPMLLEFYEIKRWCSKLKVRESEMFFMRLSES